MVKQAVNNWVKQLSDENMPVFSGTVSDVTSAVNSESTSAEDVAQCILRDASLTGRLLKMANSIMYNPTGQEISTISRAVMVLGFNQVRALTMSLLLVDSLSGGIQRSMLLDEMAQAFHSAVQAQELAKESNCKSPENVFIATLLSRLGNMAFWAFSDDKKATELHNLLQDGELSERKAEQKILGFPLKDLTKRLSEYWNLSELLDNVLSEHSKEDNEAELDAIELGQELAEVAKYGWESSKAQKVLEQVAIKLDKPVLEIQDIVHVSAKRAKEVTRVYGSANASNRIPQPNQHLLDSGQDQVEVEESSMAIGEVDLVIEREVVVEQHSLHPEPNANIQLTIMQDITRAVEEKPSLNIMLEMVLEGIYRGVGMDRSLFGILTPDRKKLVCKYAIGTDNELLCKELVINITSDKNIFKQVVVSKMPMNVPADPKKLTGTLSKNTLDLLGKPPYLIMPTIIRDKVIGIFMADRNDSGREIEEKDFIAFQQFCQQANMGITFLSMKV